MPPGVRRPRTPALALAAADPHRWPGHPGRGWSATRSARGDTATGLAVRYHAWTRELRSAQPPRPARHAVRRPSGSGSRSWSPAAPQRRTRTGTPHQPHATRHTPEQQKPGRQPKHAPHRAARTLERSPTSARPRSPGRRPLGPRTTGSTRTSPSRSPGRSPAGSSGGSPRPARSARCRCCPGTGALDVAVRRPPAEHLRAARQRHRRRGADQGAAPPDRGRSTPSRRTTRGSGRCSSTGSTPPRRPTCTASPRCTTGWSGAGTRSDRHRPAGEARHADRRPRAARDRRTRLESRRSSRVLPLAWPLTGGRPAWTGLSRTR